MDGSTTASTTSTAPLATAGLGTVSVSGTADKFSDVAAWIEAVNRVNGLAGSTFESADKKKAEGGTDTVGTDAGTGDAAEKIEFSGSAVVVPAALSHNYDRKAS
jgi:hypothetical protein